MRCFLGVAECSAEPQKLVHLMYKPKGGPWLDPVSADTHLAEWQKLLQQVQENSGRCDRPQDLCQKCRHHCTSCDPEYPIRNCSGC